MSRGKALNEAAERRLSFIRNVIFLSNNQPFEDLKKLLVSTAKESFEMLVLLEMEIIDLAAVINHPSIEELPRKKLLLNNLFNFLFVVFLKEESNEDCLLYVKNCSKFDVIFNELSEYVNIHKNRVLIDLFCKESAGRDSLIIELNKILKVHAETSELNLDEIYEIFSKEDESYDVDILRIISKLSESENVNKIFYNERSLLFHALTENKLSAAILLIKKGATIREAEKIEILEKTIIDGNKTIFQLTLDCVNKIDHTNYTIIDTALKLKKFSFALMFLEKIYEEFLDKISPIEFSDLESVYSPATLLSDSSIDSGSDEDGKTYNEKEILAKDLFRFFNKYSKTSPENAAVLFATIIKFCDQKECVEQFFSEVKKVGRELFLGIKEKIEEDFDYLCQQKRTYDAFLMLKVCKILNQEYSKTTSYDAREKSLAVKTIKNSSDLFELMHLANERRDLFEKHHTEQKILQSKDAILHLTRIAEGDQSFRQSPFLSAKKTPRSSLRTISDSSESASSSGSGASMPSRRSSIEGFDLPPTACAVPSTVVEMAGAGCSASQLKKISAPTNHSLSGLDKFMQRLTDFSSEIATMSRATLSRGGGGFAVGR